MCWNLFCCFAIKRLFLSRSGLKRYFSEHPSPARRSCKFLNWRIWESPLRIPLSTFLNQSLKQQSLWTGLLTAWPCLSWVCWVSRNLAALLFSACTAAAAWWGVPQLMAPVVYTDSFIPVIFQTSCFFIEKMRFFSLLLAFLFVCFGGGWEGFVLWCFLTLIAGVYSCSLSGIMAAVVAAGLSSPCLNFLLLLFQHLANLFCFAAMKVLAVDLYLEGCLGFQTSLWSRELKWDLCLTSQAGSFSSRTSTEKSWIRQVVHTAKVVVKSYFKHSSGRTRTLCIWHHSISQAFLQHCQLSSWCSTANEPERGRLN